IRSCWLVILIAGSQWLKRFQVSRISDIDLSQGEDSTIIKGGERPILSHTASLRPSSVGPQRRVVHRKVRYERDWIDGLAGAARVALVGSISLSPPPPHLPHKW
ncbi:MAG: hypothetical protein ACKPKO_59090, partial [Candidatus Fonsibacter sp.]